MCEPGTAKAIRDLAAEIASKKTIGPLAINSSVVRKPITESEAVEQLMSDCAKRIMDLTPAFLDDLNSRYDGIFRPVIADKSWMEFFLYAVVAEELHAISRFEEKERAERLFRLVERHVNEEIGDQAFCFISLFISALKLSSEINDNFILKENFGSSGTLIRTWLGEDKAAKFESDIDGIKVIRVMALMSVTAHLADLWGAWKNIREAYDITDPKTDRNRELLLGIIQSTGSHIQREEGKSQKEATYLAICTLFSDLMTKGEKGKKGYLLLMNILGNEYREHNSDVITYLAVTTGQLPLASEHEAQFISRHRKVSAYA